MPFAAFYARSGAADPAGGGARPGRDRDRIAVLPELRQGAVAPCTTASGRLLRCECAFRESRHGLLLADRSTLAGAAVLDAGCGGAVLPRMAGAAGHRVARGAAVARRIRTRAAEQGARDRGGWRVGRGLIRLVVLVDVARADACLLLDADAGWSWEWARCWRWQHRASPRAPPGTIRMLVPLGLGGIAVSTLAYSATTSFPGYAALLPVASTAMILAAGIERRRSSPAVRLLESRPFVAVGDVSYSFYLWHWPVLVIAAQYVGHPLSLAANLTLVGLALAISLLTTRWFEDPIRHSKRLAPPGWPGAVAGHRVTHPAGGCQLDAGDPPAARPARRVDPARGTGRRNPPRPAPGGGRRATPDAGRGAGGLERVAAARYDTGPQRAFPIGAGSGRRHLPARRLRRVSQRYHSNVCRFGDATANRMIGVYGDSHAQMWMPGIVRGMQEQRLRRRSADQGRLRTAKWLHPNPVMTAPAGAPGRSAGSATFTPI